MVFDFFINNPTAAYFLVVLAIIFSYVIQFRLKSTFSKYSKVFSRNNVPANVIARQILDSYGLQHIVVRHIDGDLTDHFDPRSNEVALSDATFFSTSVAAIGVAAHEVGHAIQHNKKYLPIKIRSLFVPIAQIGSKGWIILFMLGMLMGIPIFVDIGIILFGCVVLFQLLTLPVEFDASKRALSVIRKQGLLESDEIGGARKTLNAAAMTYIAGLMVALTQLIRLIALSNNRRRD